MCQLNNTRRSKTSTMSLPMQTPANILSPSCSISQEEDGKICSTLNSKPLKVLMCSENVFRKYAQPCCISCIMIMCTCLITYHSRSSSSLFLAYIVPLAQVNGIARRVTMYQDGLSKLDCTVDSLHPDMGLNTVLSHVNPW